MMATRTDAKGPIVVGWKRCPECYGYGKVRKTAENATVPGPLGTLQACLRCGGTGAVRR